MSLNSTSKKMNLVINFPKDLKQEIIINDLESYLKSSVMEYYFILHDKDVKEDDRTLKTPHLHLVVMLDTKCRLLTFLNRICKNVFKDDKYSNCISIQSVKDYDYAISYLTHKNDLLKYQYKSNQVKTNNREYLDAVLSYDVKREIDIDYIIQLCEMYDSPLDVLRVIGLWNAKTYLNVVSYVFQKVKKLPF